MAKLATCRRGLQHNIALDSVLTQKESITPLKTRENLKHCCKKQKAHWGSARFLTCVFGQQSARESIVYAIAFTREDRRDILREAVFL